MILRVVPLYAAVMALLFVLLSVNVIRGRRSQRIPLGVAGSTELERRVRVQANFAEYAPFALLLLAMADIRGAPAALLHLLCLGLLIGRVAHAWGVSQTVEDYRFRVAGMGATLTVIIGAAILLMLG